MTDRLSLSKTLRLTDSDVEAAAMDAYAESRGCRWRVVEGAVPIVEQMAQSLILPQSFEPRTVEPKSTLGTLSIWGAPADPLLDLVKCLDALANLPPKEKPLRIVECRDIGSGRVYQERWRFSGGVNLSAAERNAERLAEAEQRDGTVYVEKATGNVYCSPKGAAKLKQQMPDAPIGPAPLELDWVSPAPLFPEFDRDLHFTWMGARYV